MNTTWSALAVAALASLTHHASAQLTFNSQSRTIFAQAIPSDLFPPSTASAAGFAPFNQSVNSVAPGFVTHASQNSVLQQYSISAQGTADPGQGTINGPVGNANSNCNVVFTTLNTQTFNLQGSAEYGGASLTGPGVNIQVFGSNVNQSGTFQAGATYTLAASTSGGVEGGRARTGTFNVSLTVTSRPLGTAFVYQGAARHAGAPINGPTDFEFRLFAGATGSPQVGPTLSANAVPVSNGVFSRELDFGAVFDSNEHWLEVRMRYPAGAGNYSTISPRTRIGAVPNALYAAAVPWDGVLDVPENVWGAFSPWQPVSGGIGYSDGGVSVGAVTSEVSLNVANGIKVGAGGVGGRLAFGTIGNTLGSADNTDFIAFDRVNLTPPSGNQSELRLILGDDPVLSSNSQDYFTIGTIPGGAWTPTFGFRSDGFASKPGGGSWANISDPRTKHDVTPLRGTLDRLLNLRGYQYFYNDAEVKNGRALPGVQIGLMADEVERVFPDWVTRDRDGMRMVTERATTALMVEALRDLRTEKDAQLEALRAERDAELKALRDENAKLNDRLEKLERLLQVQSEKH